MAYAGGVVTIRCGTERLAARAPLIRRAVDHEDGPAGRRLDTVAQEIHEAGSELPLDALSGTVAALRAETLVHPRDHEVARPG